MATKARTYSKKTPQVTVAPKKAPTLYEDELDAIFSVDHESSIKKRKDSSGKENVVNWNQHEDSNSSAEKTPKKMKGEIVS